MEKEYNSACDCFYICDDCKHSYNKLLRQTASSFECGGCGWCEDCFELADRME